MKRIVVGFLILLLAACSSSRNRVEIIRPEVDLRQLVGPGDTGFGRGLMDLQFEVRVANRSSEPITIKRVELSSVDTGAYALRREFHNFNQVVAPDNFSTVTFWNRAQAFGRTFEASTEPVMVRAVVYFESPAGPFQQIIQRQLSQFRGRGD